MRFSIVIPTYNMEKYLSEALESVSNQTFEEFEAIVVDDCSKDRSREIAKKWAEVDSRITLIELEENGGVSKARNAGLAKAQGEYVLFFDPDDLWEETLLENLERNIVSNGQDKPDIYVFDFYEEYFDRDGNLELVREISCDNDGDYSTKDVGAIMEMERATMLGYPWNKAYKRSLLMENNVRFPEGQSFGEDIMFNADAFQMAQTFYVMKSKLYHYRNMQKARLTSGKVVDYWQLQKTRIERLIDLQRSLGAEELSRKDVLADVYFRSFVSMIMRESSNGKSGKELLDLCQLEAKSQLFSLMSKDYEPKGKMAKLVYGPAANEDFATAIRRASEISFVKEHFSGVFNRLKTRR